jgi:hypothetical protein
VSNWFYRDRKLSVIFVRFFVRRLHAACYVLYGRTWPKEYKHRLVITHSIPSSCYTYIRVL